jgi:NADH:ubiquinone oxidoreductase subunit 5 (subunit L)/multisubunit Na+/H+ antiporter MnhA subunit
LAGRINLRLRNILSFLFIASSFVLSVSLIPSIVSGKLLLVEKTLPLGFNFSFMADGLAIFMACVSSLISAIIVLFSFDYISHYEYQSEYYSMVTLFLGAMMGIIFSANLVFLYIFWEITAICSWRLVGFFRERHYVIRADKTFLVTVFGALVMLIGFISIYQQTGSFDLLVIKDKLRINPLSNLTVLLILVGIFSKSATLPFHTWLPDAGVAPSPVTALLHAAVLVKIGVYVFARLFVATFNVQILMYTVVPYVAGISALIAAGAALVDTDFKRIVAYSTISQIGFIFLGLSAQNTIGIVGALLFILMHGFAKAGLFLCAGIVEQNTKTKDITKLGGLIKTMPLTAAAFLCCAFSVMGVPPFGGFFSKYLVFNGVIKDQDWIVTAIFLIGAVLTIIYLFRLFGMVFMGEQRMPEAREGSTLMVASVLSLAALSLAAGVLIAYPFRFSEFTVFQMLGMIK